MRKITLWQILNVLISLALFAVVYSTGGDLMAALVLSVFYCILSMLLLDRNGNHVLMLLYLCAFFVFLMGRIIAEVFLEQDRWFIMDLTDEAYQTMYTCLLLSLLSLLVGYSLVKPGFGRVLGSVDRLGENTVYLQALRQVSKLASILCYCIVFVENVERMLYIGQVGYQASYLDFNSRLPSVVRAVGSVAPVAFAVFLATLPSKKEMLLPLCLFGASLAAYFLGGFRYELISGVLLLLFFFLMRNITDKKVWLPKWVVVAGCVSVPFLFILLQYMSSWRLNETDVAYEGGPLAEFLYGVGGSGQLIGYAEMYAEELRERDVWFSFGRVWRQMNGNAFAQTFIGNAIYKNQTVENALYGHSFGDAITYLVKTDVFLQGGGMGSCYIAELYLDFSYWGVALGNIALGAVIRKASLLKNGRLLTNIFALIVATHLMRIPRDTFDYILNQFMGVKNIAFLLLLHMAATTLKKHRSSPAFTAERKL